MTTQLIHVFEQAGLGKAPFKCIGMTAHHRHCDYCNTAILYNFHIIGADGKQFIVGSDCVMKTDDLGLQRVVKHELKKLRNQNDLDRIARNKKELFENVALRTKLASMPHPYNYQNKTMLDYMEYCFKSAWAGKTAKLKVCRKLEPYIEAVIPKGATFTQE